MAHSSNNNNEERRSLIPNRAQLPNVDTTRNFERNPEAKIVSVIKLLKELNVFSYSIQSRFLASNTEAELRQNLFHQQLQQFIAEHGTKDFNESIKTIMEQEHQEPVLIAVTGETGVGKSTFINTMRGLRYDHPEAAPTNGEEECTMEVKEYLDPRNRNLIYCDLPGIGSPDFRTEEYSGKVLLNRYDFFIILSNNRFTDNHIYLAQKIKSLGKKFYFVRTRIDESLNNERDKNIGQPFNEEDYVNNARATNAKNLIKHVGIHPVFVISGSLKNFTKWDFPKLIEALINDAPDIKKEVIIRTITVNSHQVIKQKVDVLKLRILMVATAAAAVEVVQIPFLSFACNLGIITHEIHNYMKDFGLDENSLENLAKQHDMNRAEFEKKIFGTSEILSSNNESVITEAVKKVLKETATANVAAECTRNAPEIGQIGPPVASFVSVAYALDTLLTEISELAMKLVDELVQLDK